MTVPSPFLHGNPLPPGLFTGRRRELASVFGRLLHHGQSTAIVGEPRSGKTSFLDYLASPEAASLRSHGDGARIIVIYVDCHSLDRGVDDSAFWECVFEALDDPAGPFPAGSPVHTAVAACRQDRFQSRPIKSLLSVLRAAGVRIALLIDEFDYLVQHCVTNPHSFFGSLRSLASLSRGTLALVLASRRSLSLLDEVAQGPGYAGSPFFNFMAEETLGPLHPDEVEVILARAGDRFSPDDQALVRDLGGGHPYLVQLCADALFRAHDDGEPDPAARRHLATAHALREASRVLADIWRHWSPSQRYVIASLAAGGRLGGGRFRSAIDALETPGFVSRSGAVVRIAPRLLHRWCLGELQARSRGVDPLRDWIKQEDRLDLVEDEWKALLHAVRATTGASDAPLSMQAPSLRPPAPQQCFKVFFSYSHKDDRFRNHLDQHLATLKREGAIETWHDQRISPGSDWRETIADALREADLILLLISADYIASDFCVDVELRHAIQRHKQGTARVIPIPVRATNWGSLPFAGLAPLPANGKPIALAGNRDAAWTEVANGIRQVVASLARRAKGSAPP